jgi:hypothetical protein
MAYSTWNRRPSGLNVLTPLSYSERVRNILRGCSWPTEDREQERRNDPAVVAASDERRELADGDCGLPVGGDQARLESWCHLDFVAGAVQQALGEE